MMFLRLIKTAVRKYDEQPGSRRAAVTMLLMNALRLAFNHLGEEETTRLVKSTMTERKGAAA